MRYRRYIKEGIEMWNRAYEGVGILDAIEVRYQDKESGAHMEKDPEDVRYNFIRWLNNNIGTAIGPSRAHPETGEIFDADVVLTGRYTAHFLFDAFLDVGTGVGLKPAGLSTLPVKLGDGS